VLLGVVTMRYFSVIQRIVASALFAFLEGRIGWDERQRELPFRRRGFERLRTRCSRSWVHEFRQRISYNEPATSLESHVTFSSYPESRPEPAVSLTNLRHQSCLGRL
jgi:hypothetical protein